MKKIDIKQLAKSVFGALKRQDPMNIVLFVIVIIFIVSRITSMSQQNDMMIATSPQAIQSSSTNEEASGAIETKSIEKTTMISTEPTTEIPTEIPTESTADSTAEPKPETRMAFSKETGKYYTIEAFSKLSVEEFMTFSGVGEVTAQAIYTFIQQKGTLSSFDELLEVKGIGEKKLFKLMNP